METPAAAFLRGGRSDHEVTETQISIVQTGAAAESPAPVYCCAFTPRLHKC